MNPSARALLSGRLLLSGSPMRPRRNVQNRNAIKQGNSHDWCVHMCMCMELLARGRSVFEFLEQKGTYYRRRMAAQKLSGRLLGG